MCITNNNKKKIVCIISGFSSISIHVSTISILDKFLVTSWICSEDLHPIIYDSDMHHDPQQGSVAWSIAMICKKDLQQGSIAQSTSMI